MGVSGRLGGNYASRDNWGPMPSTPFKIAYMGGCVCVRACVRACVCVHSMHSHGNVDVALCARVRVCEYIRVKLGVRVRPGEGVQVWVHVSVWMWI